ncbi:MAG: flagellar basal body P-ring formation chaperone FlgA, partial [Smithellaceae bacterium]|nr:flagellar basal body P-ring formation chaperone FlgA [Smithellaceae bacterium]
LEIAQDVVVSNRALPKGAILSEEDVVLVKKWIRNKSFNHVTSLEEVLGKRLTAGIPYKAELKKNMIAERIYIKKGMNVRIVLNSDSISITALGVSEQDGTLGEIIKVRNISSNRAIFARVLNESVVEVEQ